MQISNIPPKVTPESVKLWDGIHRMEEVEEGGSEERQRGRESGGQRGRVCFRAKRDASCTPVHVLPHCHLVTSKASHQISDAPEDLTN